MRCYYPHEFFSALLTNSIDDKTEKMVGYINDVTNMGIKVLPPDINTSEVSFSVEGDSIRYGLLAIKNTGITILSEIVEERKIHGPYIDLQDLVERNINSVKSNTLEALINSGSFDSFPHSREEMLAILPAITKAAAKARKKMAKDQMALDSSFFAGMSDDPAFHFPRVEYPTDVTPMTMLEKLKMEQAATGMFISGHPLDSFAEEIKLRPIRLSQRFPKQMTVIKSALLVLLQRYARLPPAKRAAWLSSPSKIRRATQMLLYFPRRSKRMEIS